MTNKYEPATRLRIGKGEDAYDLVYIRNEGVTLVGTHEDMHGYGTIRVQPTDIMKVNKPSEHSTAIFKAYVMNQAKKDVAPAPKKQDNGPATTKPKTTKSTGATKFDQAVVIARQNPEADRKTLINLLVDQLKMTPAGASTYASTARKAASK